MYYGLMSDDHAIADVDKTAGKNVDVEDSSTTSSETHKLSARKAVDKIRSVARRWYADAHSFGRRHPYGSLLLVACALVGCWTVRTQMIPGSDDPTKEPAGPHYVIERIDTPDVLLAADGSTEPANTWRKNRHGGPYKRTIDVQLQFDASCIPSTADVQSSKTGSRWMALELSFKTNEGKTCDGKKTEWTWWRVSVTDAEGAEHSSSADSLLPLDTVTSVTASWAGWPNGSVGPLPQWKTQMDKLD